MNIDYHVFIIVASFIVLDIVSGFSQACVNKTVDSSVMRRGLWHKTAYILTIVLGVLCEYSVVYIDLGFTIPITLPICGFICATEMVSIVENIGRINPELAGSKLLDYFSQSKSRRNDDGKNNDED